VGGGAAQATRSQVQQEDTHAAFALRPSARLPAGCGLLSLSLLDPLVATSAAAPPRTLALPLHFCRQAGRWAAACRAQACATGRAMAPLVWRDLDESEEICEKKILFQIKKQIESDLRTRERRKKK